jgi:hypothetical protein
LSAKAFQIIRTLRLDRLFRFRVSLTTHPFTDYFIGFEKTEAVREIFGDQTEKVLQKLRVEFFPLVGYMGVNDSNGHLMVNPRYLNNGGKVDIYLDVIHELVHVRQHIQGRELFDTNYSYAERPTEIEAYRYAVKEARRLGLSDARICEYLKVPFMSGDNLRKLTNALNVNCEK